MQSQKLKFPKQAGEDKTFWQHHIAAQAVSGISKTTYCGLNQVDYARFIYWSRKKSVVKTVGSLVAVKLKPAAENATATRVTVTDVLCTLTFTRGDCLQVYHERVLSLILDKLM